MLRSNSKSLGNHAVSSEEEKERLRWERFAEKEGGNWIYNVPANFSATVAQCAYAGHFVGGGGGMSEHH